MKKIFIKALAFLLIIASILPLAVACKDDPPPDNDDDDENQNENQGGEPTTPTSYIEATRTGWTELVMVDLDSDYYANNYNNFTDNLVYNSELDQTVYSWDVAKKASLDLAFPSAINMGNCYAITFSLYSPAVTNTDIQMQVTPASGFKTAEYITLDFQGWKTFYKKTDNFTVVNPYPDALSVSFAYLGSETPTLLITDIKAITPIYELSVPSGIDINDSAIYKHITDRYIAYELGTAEQGANPTDDRASRVAYIDDICRRSILNFDNTYNNGEVNSLYGQHIDMTGSTPIETGSTGDALGLAVRSVYNQLNGLARAYACYGGTYYKDQSVLNRILLGLEYAYTYSYGVPILTNGITYGDWYNWDIAIPEHLIATLILIQDDIDRSLIAKYLEPFVKLVPLPLGTASNLLAFCKLFVLSGALLRNANRIAMANDLALEAFYNIDEIPDGVTFTPTADGFYSDGSFIQHDSIAYTGSYGIGLLSSVTFIAYLTSGGPFALHGDVFNNHYDWVVDSFLPVIYGKNFMTALNGRANSIDTEASNTKTVIKYMLTIIDYAPADIKAKLESYVKYYQLLFNDDFGGTAPMHMIDYCKALMADESVAAAAQSEYAKVFGAMDRVVQHGTKYGVALSLSSTRIGKYESINTSNEHGFYHGDGMIYIYTDGYDYNKYFINFANPYLMPGTTVNTAKRNFINLSPALRGADDFAGGAYYGKYASIGYINSYDTNKAAASNTFKEREDTMLTARKSYFLFDNEIVCVGTGINDCSGDNVLTVVENRLWRSSDVLSINGQQINAPATVETEISARTMHFSNMGGYVFLRANESGADKDGNLLCYKKATNGVVESADSQYEDLGDLANTKKDFLEITLNHGVGDGTVENNKYAYVYLPEATVEETENYSDTAILAYKTNVHAVIEKNLDIIGCNFFIEGSEETVSVTGANQSYTSVRSISAETLCSIIITKGENGEYHISASDPTQTYRNIIFSVEIEGVTAVSSCDSAVTATVTDGLIDIVINTENCIGNTFTLTVK